MKGPSLALAILDGAKAKKKGPAAPAMSEEAEAEDSDVAITAAAGRVRTAFESGDDEALGQALRDFIDCC